MEKLNPQGEIFAIWRRWSAATRNADPTLRWRDAANVSNSIMDAEILTCLLLPATQLPRFSLSQYITASPDTVSSLHDPHLKEVGAAFELDYRDTAHILEMLEAFFENNAPDGIPSFSIGSYGAIPEGLDEHGQEIVPTLEVTDSYAFSLSVCIYTLLLIRDWQASGKVSVPKVKDRWTRIWDLASTRLTYALSGLLSSFCVDLMQPGEYENNTGHAWHSDDDQIMKLRDTLNLLQAGVGSDTAFSVGWSWGPIAPESRLAFDVDGEGVELRGSKQPAAQPAPYFYFTVSALDAIADLNARRVQSGNFLTPQQLMMSSRLLQYWHMTIDYWTQLAFTVDEGSDQWAIEDIPWTAADGQTTDYWSLYMLTIITRGDAQGGHRLSPNDLDRLIPLAEDLASRARITRRPIPAESDPALDFHSPGLVVRMEDGDQKEILNLRVFDFAPRLLKLCGRLLLLATDDDFRERVLVLANQIWAHLALRRVPPTNPNGSPSSSWDTLEKVWSSFKDTRGLAQNPVHHHADRVASWYITERTLDALVAIASSGLTQRPPTPGVDKLIQEVASELEYVLASPTTARMSVAGEKYSVLLSDIKKGRDLAGDQSATGLAKLLHVAEQLESLDKHGDT